LMIELMDVTADRAASVERTLGMGKLLLLRWRKR
jgi:hypothetical protein